MINGHCTTAACLYSCRHACLNTCLYTCLHALGGSRRQKVPAPKGIHTAHMQTMAPRSATQRGAAWHGMAWLGMALFVFRSMRAQDRAVCAQALFGSARDRWRCGGHEVGHGSSLIHCRTIRSSSASRHTNAHHTRLHSCTVAPMRARLHIHMHGHTRRHTHYVLA